MSRFDLQVCETLPTSELLTFSEPWKDNAVRAKVESGCHKALPYFCPDSRITSTPRDLQMLISSPTFLPQRQAVRTT